MANKTKPTTDKTTEKGKDKKTQKTEKVEKNEKVKEKKPIEKTEKVEKPEKKEKTGKATNKTRSSGEKMPSTNLNSKEIDYGTDKAIAHNSIDVKRIVLLKVYESKVVEKTDATEHTPKSGEKKHSKKGGKEAQKTTYRYYVRYRTQEGKYIRLTFGIPEDPDNEEADIVTASYKAISRDANGYFNSVRVSLPWPTNVDKSEKKKIPQIDRNPDTRTITDTIMMVYERICELLYEVLPQDISRFDENGGKALESVGDVKKQVTLPVYFPRYQEKEGVKLPKGVEKNEINYQYEPSVYLKLYTEYKDDPKHEGKKIQIVKTPFYDRKTDEQMNVVSLIDKGLKFTPMIVCECVFVGSTIGIHLFLKEANKVEELPYSGGNGGASAFVGTRLGGALSLSIQKKIEQKASAEKGDAGDAGDVEDTTEKKTHQTKPAKKGTKDIVSVKVGKGGKAKKEKTPELDSGDSGDSDDSGGSDLSATSSDASDTE